MTNSYYGSGKLIKKAIAKYGKENFTKEILKTFDTYQQAEQYEAELVDAKFTLDENTYNINLGGNVRARVGENNPSFGRSHPPELQQQIIRNRLS